MNSTLNDTLAMNNTFFSNGTFNLSSPAPPPSPLSIPPGFIAIGSARAIQARAFHTVMTMTIILTVSAWILALKLLAGFMYKTNIDRLSTAIVISFIMYACFQIASNFETTLEACSTLNLIGLYNTAFCASVSFGLIAIKTKVYASVSKSKWFQYHWKIIAGMIVVLVVYRIWLYTTYKYSLNAFGMCSLQRNTVALGILWGMELVACVYMVLIFISVKRELLMNSRVNLIVDADIIVIGLFILVVTPSIITALSSSDPIATAWAVCGRHSSALIMIHYSAYVMKWRLENDSSSFNGKASVGFDQKSQSQLRSKTELPKIPVEEDVRKQASV